MVATYCKIKCEIMKEGDFMAPIHAWNNIINRLRGSSVELPTVPKTKKVPVWFSVTTDGKTIFFDKAIDHIPSSKLSIQRKLNYKTFEKVYPLYLKRENGEAVSSEVTAITVDQVYYFSLIKHFA
jgi:hypothetical protein